jgi:hypothetical protein
MGNRKRSYVSQNLPRQQRKACRLKTTFSGGGRATKEAPASD